jgi:hypothetical protein
MTNFDATLVWCAIVAALVTFWYFVVKYGGRAVEVGRNGRMGLMKKDGKKPR